MPNGRATQPPSAPPVYVRVQQGTVWSEERRFTGTFRIGRDPECAAHRVGSFYHRQALWTGGRRHVGLNSRLTCIRGSDRFTARRLACTGVIQP